MHEWRIVQQFPHLRGWPDTSLRSGSPMEKWLIYALLATLFAGITAVIAKLGLTGISADLGMTIRTACVFAFVLLFAAAAVPRTEYQLLTLPNFLWLGLSALTTTLSWIFYYRAIKLGEVSTVALIDKGSVLVALAFAWWVLKESITLHKLAGAALIVAGLILIARKQA